MLELDFELPHAITTRRGTVTCNDPGARGLIFQLFGKECEIRNLNSIEDRNTKLFLFNGI